MLAPWYVSYEPGVPQVMPAVNYSSLADFFVQTCARFAAKPAFSSFATCITYQQLNDYSSAFANFLQYQLNLMPGERVAIMLPNLLQYPVSLMGILRAGLVVVNVNPMFTQNELLHILQDSGAKAIVVWDGAAHVVQDVMAQVPELQVIVTQLGDLFPGLKRTAMQFMLRYVRKQIPRWAIAQAIGFKQALALGQRMPAPVVSIGWDDLAFLQYTGGTTGTPKGVMLTHYNMLANLNQAAVWVKSRHQPGDDDIVLSPLPFYHIFSLLANCLLFMHMGAHNILIANPRDIAGLIKIMQQYPFQFISGVNTLFNALLQNPACAKIDFSRLKTALSGGMAVQTTVAEKWQQLTGQPMLVGYGLTETSPAISITPMHSKKFNGSAGLPIPSTALEIRDAAGKVLAIDQAGELWVKGPQVMRGYWQQPAATQSVFDNTGWLRTGDIARIDAQGFVYLIDRIKDMIVVSGFKVYPSEVEDIMAKMPGIKEVAAVGVLHEHSGEVVKLFIVKKDPRLTEAAVRQYAYEHLTGYKHPHAIEFCDSLPKSNVGKILRRALRE